jgi:hypothetical protein
MLRRLGRWGARSLDGKQQGTRHFGYSCVAVGLSDPLPGPPSRRPAAPLVALRLESGATLAPLEPILLGRCAHYPSLTSQNSVFAVHGSHGAGTLPYLCDIWACAALLGDAAPWDLCLFEDAILDAGHCGELHQHALALVAPVQRILARPSTILSRGAHGHVFASPLLQRHCLTPPSELWDKLCLDQSCGRARTALEELTRALAAAAAGEHGILAIEYDR